MAAVEAHRGRFDDHRHQTILDHAVQERPLLLLPQEGEGDEVQTAAARGERKTERVHVLHTLARVVGENGTAGHTFHVREAVLRVKRMQKVDLHRFQSVVEIFYLISRMGRVLKLGLQTLSLDVETEKRDLHRLCNRLFINPVLRCSYIDRRVSHRLVHK